MVASAPAPGTSKNLDPHPLTAARAPAKPPFPPRRPPHWLLAALGAALTLGTLFGSPFSSCTSSSDGKKDEAEDELSDADLEGDGNALDDAEGDGNPAAAKKSEASTSGLPHPRAATAWHTRVLVETVPQPRRDRINACIEQIHHLAADAGNHQDMILHQAQITTVAASDINTYHFCFYQMMVKLDERLDLGGEVMTDLATAFFDGMRELWLLARGLDAYFGQDVYFNYLRHRYVQMSRTYFGRDMEVIGPPLGRYSPDFGTLNVPMTKPAGPAPVGE